MEVKALHIINGDDLTQKMQELNLPGKAITWRELLCEGPTHQEVGSEDFISMRKKFLKKAYHISGENYDKKFVGALRELKQFTDYDEVVLWFEFDLFCHINMLAAISYFLENKQPAPMYLVCSKKQKGEEPLQLQSLTNLSPRQLKNHYDKRIALTSGDLEMASLIWELYCSNNPMRLKQKIKLTSNFEYLSSCIRAHIERFPNSVTGINSLEKNVLRLIKTNTITSEMQLLGYALQYQGYYGYSDTQMQRLLRKLSIFFNKKEGKIILSENGEKVLEESKNFYQHLKNEEYLGGAKMYDYLYDKESHSVLKL